MQSIQEKQLEKKHESDILRNKFMIKIQNTRKVQERLLENQRQVIEDNLLYIYCI